MKEPKQDGPTWLISNQLEAKRALKRAYLADSERALRKAAELDPDIAQFEAALIVLEK